MQEAVEVTTACLDVARQMNELWASIEPQAVDAASSETVLLCSDIICIEDILRNQPDFDITSHVLEQALVQTRRYCSESGTSIAKFHSVDVLRLMRPGQDTSFLFLFEAALVA